MTTPLPALRRLFLRYPEFKIVILFLLIVSGTLAFGHLAQEISEGDTAIFDLSLLHLIRTAGKDVRWMDEVARDLTALGSTAVIVLVTSGAVLYLLLAKERISALLLCVSVIGGQVLSSALKVLFARPRPDIVALSDHVSASFPSGHAMLSTVTYLTVGILLSRAQGSRPTQIFPLLVSLIVIVLVGISRVYLGLHWPTDVLGGWCVGSVWALFTWVIFMEVKHNIPRVRDNAVP